MEFLLHRALDLARRGQSRVEPNPRVGAVVALPDGRILGEGWHERLGGPHAEVNAVNAVADKALLRQATLFVTLEPCNHHGRTPPCTNLILAHGIPRVVVGSPDPNPQMAGRSIAFLRAKGVEVAQAEDPAPFIALNRHFWVNQHLGRPYVHLKWAQTTNGYLGSGTPARLRITGPQANRHTHYLRTEHAAILVGGNTQRQDAPQLTARLYPGPSPQKVLWSQAPPPTDSWLHVRGAVEAWLPGLLTAHGIGSILVEGGRNVLEGFLASGLWDEATRFTGANAVAGGVPGPALPTDWAWDTHDHLGPDLRQWRLNPATRSVLG